MMALKEITNTPSAKRFTISLRWLMILGFGGLVAGAVALVLTISVTTNFTNTYSLLNSRAFLLLDTMERSIRSQTDQAERTVMALAKLHDGGELIIGQLDADGTRQRNAKLISLMVASPVVETLLVYDTSGQRSGMFRDQTGAFHPIAFETGVKNELTALLTAKIPENGKEPVWGEPVVVNNILFHNVGYPLISGNKVVGIAVAAIGQSSLNQIIVDLPRDNLATAFVLNDENQVIAHSKNYGQFQERPIIDINDFPDAAMQQFNDAEHVKELESAANQNMTIHESGRRTGKSGYVFITRKLTGYAAKPYRLGAYFAKTDMGAEVVRIVGSIFAGLIALTLAVMASAHLARRLSRPMKEIAKVANNFSTLDLENFTPLPSSRIREIDDQAHAMNAMHIALGEFSRYVPHPLVKRLMTSGSEAVRSVEREITIMFADIVGFTSMSEDLDAAEIAAVLNSHFDKMCAQIDMHNGTVDKFIGDGLMAFWGAPNADDNQASNAINAAAAIVDAIRQHNVERKNDNLPPIRLRIGIHTGRVVVGNVGSTERQNYTIVGDAVNVANRLEQYGKHFIGDGEAITLVSRVTWEKAGNPESLHSIGLQKLRGREALIDTFAMGDALSDTATSQKITG